MRNYRICKSRVIFTVYLHVYIYIYIYIHRIHSSSYIIKYTPTNNKIRKIKLKLITSYCYFVNWKISLKHHTTWKLRVVLSSYIRNKGVLYTFQVLMYQTKYLVCLIEFNEKSRERERESKSKERVNKRNMKLRLRIQK